jgi:response regulator RpfG family c-di-GMP phosphodiesterase
MFEPLSEAEASVLVVVDDDPLVHELVRHIVADLRALRVEAFDDAAIALAWLRTHEADVVITDYQMPGLSGTELIAAVRHEPHLADIPIMMITASEDRAVRVAALTTGANDVLSKPIEPTEVRARTTNMLAIRRGQRLVAQRSSWLEAEVRRATAAIAARERETILRLSKAAEYRDWETGSHIIRVSLYARLIARGLQLPTDEQDMLFQAAPMHDVGKIGIADAILLKVGELDAAEFEAIKEHTVIGHRILTGSSSPLLQAAADIALTHHERVDGTGYPRRLHGDAIPLHGRVVAVADTFDALTSRRPYKAAWPAPLAWEYLRQHVGTRFDAACVEAFDCCFTEAEQIRSTLLDEPAEPAQRAGSPAAAAAADGF